MNRTLTTVSLTLLMIGLAPAQSEEPSVPVRRPSVYAALTKVPQMAALRPNPLEHDPDAVAAGSKLFRMHCAECHGDVANGSRRGPSLRAEPVQQASPGTIFWLLTNGVVRKGMPVWSKLPEPQRWQLVSFIKSLKQAAD